MKELIDAQLGRILLVLALVITGLSVYYNGPQDLPPVEDKLLARPVMVQLDKAALAVASAEVYFVPGPASLYLTGRDLFERKKEVRVFNPVDIDIPSASVMRPPQELPDPGPSLDGADKLPRWGDEFPPVVLPPTPPVVRSPIPPVAPPPIDPKKTPPKPPEKAP